MTFPIHWVPTGWYVFTLTCEGETITVKAREAEKLRKLLLNYKGNINRCWITLQISIKCKQLKVETIFFLSYLRLDMCSACTVKLSFFFLPPFHLEVPPIFGLFLCLWWACQIKICALFRAISGFHICLCGLEEILIGLSLKCTVWVRVCELRMEWMQGCGRKEACVIKTDKCWLIFNLLRVYLFFLIFFSGEPAIWTIL